MFRVILELLRIVAIIFILGSLMGALVNLIYRNRLQFSGFYKGKGKEKLSNKISIFLICFSMLMITIAPLFR
ncbi:hypothetical protein [Peribacillus sp. R9-11]|uniref:hypothetical protein n=1 Tax=Peribacillus sp. R9-11 TaxID=3073271 RepID=UPI002868FF57|nr:hypothetical protein [Peribacillus sp. R9-11]WMX54993.1 hypothetical protein RE409_23560 [Peribacillus sp. R9-11]